MANKKKSVEKSTKHRTPEEKERLDELLSGLPDEVKTAIEFIPENRKREAILILSRETKTSFSGPMPPPQILAGYENVIKGSAERILVMAETQSNHRQGIENKVIDGQLQQTKRGQIAAISLVILLTIVGTIMTFNGHPNVAMVIFATTIVSLAGIFVIGKFKEK